MIAAPPPNVIPTPIGVGPAYRPPALTQSARAGRPVGTLRCGMSGKRYGVHLELFARRRVVIVPAGIGISTARRCSYAARTRTPTGVFEIRAGSHLTLGDLFRIWGQPLARGRLAGFRSPRPLLAFVGGRRWRGDPAAIPLTRHAQIVLELDGYVPPHPGFLFSGDL
jgi:hypothetical protein